MKINKIKVMKCLKCVKEFSRRFDLVNGKYLSIFLGVFATIFKVTQGNNICERAHGKFHPRKVGKNNRESQFSFFFSNVYINIQYIKNNISPHNVYITGNF